MDLIGIGAPRRECEQIFRPQFQLPSQEMIVAWTRWEMNGPQWHLWVLLVLSTTQSRALRGTRAKRWWFTDLALNPTSLPRFTAGSHEAASVDTKSSDHLAGHHGTCMATPHSPQARWTLSLQRTQEEEPLSFYLTQALLFLQAPSSSNAGLAEEAWPLQLVHFPKDCVGLYFHMAHSKLISANLQKFFLLSS